MRNNNRNTTIVVAAAAGLLGFALVAYMMSQRDAPRQQNQAAATQAEQQPDADARPAAQPREAPARGDSFMSQILGNDDVAAGVSPKESWTILIPKVLFRFALATLLAAMLAYRPRRNLRLVQRNPYVSQTQILLAVVASALMMVVGDSAARAFGIFAAASLVRFRTNISDPKEITVLLVSLAIGLATGVGHWEVAIVLTLFVLPLLWVLEYYEPAQAFRAMELTVKTRNIERTQRTLKRIFRRHRFISEIREITPPEAEEPFGTIVYLVNVSLDVSTDQLSREIFSADPGNIEGIEWDQQKSNYIYK